MDLSQYAELFLAESREHLSACNQLLLEWERRPAAPEPVGGIFRAVHTVKGMAATMGYARVADLAHRMENLLDHLRRGGQPPADETLQLLFRATDALEKAVDLAVAGRERDADVAGVAADLDRAMARLAPDKTHAEPEFVPPPPADVGGSGRMIQVVLRPEAQIKGGRAMLIIRKAQSLGAVQGIAPSPAAFEAEDFDGRFVFRLDTPRTVAEIEAAVRSVGDVERVSVGGGGEDDDEHVTPVESAGGRSRHIRVDLRRLDSLMDLIGELVTTRGRLNELAAERKDPAIDDVAIQVSRLSADLQPSGSRGRRSSSTARSSTSWAIRWCTCCATRWTMASNRRPNGRSAARNPRARSCCRRCASARASRSASPTTAAGSTARRCSPKRCAKG